MRFFGNRSSGRQGYALARTAVGRGAEVTLVAANVSLPDPAGVKVIQVVSAAELQAAVTSAAADADVVVMAAAVADFRPVSRSTQKIKKAAAPPSIELELNPDILAELSRSRRQGQLVIGFAAETEDLAANAAAKLAAKGCDLIVANLVGDGLGFEVEHNQVLILGADGARIDVPLASKDAVANAVWHEVARRLNG